MAQALKALAYWESAAARPAGVPTFTNAGSGGSVANGTYLAGYTLVLPNGQETELSGTASTTTGGTGISTVTVALPGALPTGCQGWFAYVGTAAPLWRQGAMQTGASVQFTALVTSGTNPPTGMAELPKADSINAQQNAYAGYINAQLAVTYLLNEIARLGNPAGVTALYPY